VTIEWLRDLIIVIFGIGATVVLVIFTVMAFKLFFRYKAILDSTRRITNSIENITGCVQNEIIKPIAGIASFIQGLKQAGSLFGIFSKKEDDSHGRKR